MKELKIQNSCLVALVDDEDFDRLSKFVWYVNKNFSISRTFMSGIRRVKNISLASEVLHQHGQLFDHKDRNPLNNQKENLRPCTYSQNMMNRTKARGTTSLYKGVSWSSSRKKWCVCIHHEDRNYFLGRFDNEVDAAKAYNQKAKELFGEFANLNPV